MSVYGNAWRTKPQNDGIEQHSWLPLRQSLHSLLLFVGFFWCLLLRKVLHIRVYVWPIVIPWCSIAITNLSRSDVFPDLRYPLGVLELCFKLLPPLSQSLSLEVLLRASNPYPKITLRIR